MTVYRYDSRLPSIIFRDGFQGFHAGYSGNASFKLFGTNTVFTAGSREGAERYLNNDHNIFKNSYCGLFMCWKDLKNQKCNARKFLDDQLKAPHLYRIKTNTHSAIPFTDFHKEFGENFTAFALEGNIRGPFGDEEYVNTALQLYRKFPDFSGHYNDKIAQAYSLNDEVHLKGPVFRQRYRSGSCALCLDNHNAVISNFDHDIHYAALEHQDLAILDLLKI
ncbi:hypothetical protein [Pseudochrobactrum sp. MP213Fo]|uniref:hypothetical protein n=1 Tax=Pseudochrobactrum sp. MP213Fo TaxID=3022250 RepID=UPI003BA37121